MYVLVVGGGKVGLNLTRELMAKGHEITLIEASRRRYANLEPQLEHVVHFGDGTELWVLERAGIERADMVIAVTGDDEDNIIIAQVAREKYGRDKIIARANNIRNLEHFDLLNIKPVISATDLILRLIEHEVPQYGLVHLLTLQAEQLEIIEVEVSAGSPAVGKRVEELELPEGSLLISVLRGGAGFVPRADTMIESGDEVLLVLNPGIEEGIMQLFNTPEESFA
jgi:trk system potassium uptake protein TrkA